ncbi:putative glycoside hydrolase family 2 protein [Rosellinia necatrix]|uniref:beta-galactosidase n=1 Tax=Rosellinia necatrix TaxID=77044 RepID=A0A1W2TQK4_ROSNE|nr:putative glycoside hydrolase family 2 protein [Rosellinia necatrix]
MSPIKAHPASQPDWNNLEVLHKGTLAPRANFHIYNSVQDALGYDTTKSRTRSLSGTWKFRWAGNPFEGPEGFEHPAFDTAAWSDTPVPSMWQLNGYGKGPHYTNVNFPIPVDPPNVPFTDNETGHYVRKFTVSKALRDSQLRLRFEGVDSAYHVWLNGKQLGYHQGSRNPAEFDITGVVDQAGENTLAVKVYQYCDGTYIEDQDQWRMSGIFRDVHLIGFPAQSRIEDLFVQTKLDKDYINAKLEVRVDVTGSCEVQVGLYSPEKQPVIASSSKAADGGSVDFSFDVKAPEKWTAESPTLYHLIVTLNGTSFISQRIGFRQVEMKDGLIKVNGKRIVLKGANRHEHHPQFGRAVPYEFMKKDLLLMKTHNINAIRTSHQPSDARLYDLADELGFWVMDEADLECHGFEAICDASLSPEDRALPFRERQLLTRAKAAKWTSDNPDWEKAYVDRAVQLVRRDQLHPSVIMWSLGNEAFYGRNHVAMYNWIKSYDDSRPIHYEADIYAQTMDMYSRMYPPVEEIIEFANDETKTKPLILCEYVHAMGNGPGNIKEYVDTFYKYESLQGGFVWEWANHGLLKKDAESGDEFYAYGGDFGDVPNDGNFVMDGVLFSNHTPNPGLIEYKKAIEPIKVVSHTTEKITIVNRYDFITLDHLEASFIVLDEGKPTSHNGAVEIPKGIKPGETAELSILGKAPSADSLTGEGVIQITFRQRDATASLPAGHEIAFDEYSFSTPPQPAAAAPENASKLIITETPTLITVESATTTWAVSPVHGELRSLKKNGAEFLATSPAVTFYRAQTDNDFPQDGADWKQQLLHLATARTRSSSWGAVEGSGGAVEGSGGAAFTLRARQRFAPPVLSWSIDLDVTYTFRADGTASVRVAGTPQGDNLPRTLPRIGLGLELPSAWAGSSGEGSDAGKAAVTWYGRGPGESYADKKLSQRLGEYAVPAVDALWTDYEFPQEGGNRTDTRWVRFRHGGSGEEVTARFVNPEESGAAGRRREGRLFDFNASHYRVTDVDTAKHPHQLRPKKTENVVLRLDAAHHGLGSGSCGPRTRDEYALLTAPFEFEVVLS